MSTYEELMLLSFDIGIPISLEMLSTIRTFSSFKD